jgi:hypothetical protein
MGFELETGFIGHLQLLTTTNSSADASSRTLRFTTAQSESSQSAVSLPIYICVSTPSNF